MTETKVDIVIHTEFSDRPIVGVDTSIVGYPDQFLVKTYADDERPAILVRQLSTFLRDLSTKQAADIGELLHHAEWVITSDPAVVTARGAIHDCDQCREGVRVSVRWLQEHPGKDLLVGTLYWAAAS